MAAFEETPDSGPVGYFGLYRPAGDVKKKRYFRELGGYVALADYCKERGLSFRLIASDLRALEAELEQHLDTLDYKLRNDLAVYLGDVLCATTPGIMWEVDDGSTQLRISPRTTWDVVRHVPRKLGQSPEFLTGALAEMQRIARQE